MKLNNEQIALLVEALSGCGEDDLQLVICGLIDKRPRLVLSIPQMITTGLFMECESERFKVNDLANDISVLLTPVFAKDLTLRAKAIRNLLLTSRFSGTGLEKDLISELKELMKDADTKQHLDDFPFGRKLD